MSTWIKVSKAGLKDLNMKRVEAAFDKLKRCARPDDLMVDLVEMFKWRGELGSSCADVARNGMLANRQSLYLVHNALLALLFTPNVTDILVGERDFDSYSYTKNTIFIQLGSRDDVMVAETIMGHLLGDTYREFLGNTLDELCVARSIKRSLKSDWSKLDDIDHYNLRAFLNAVMHGDSAYEMINRPPTEMRKSDKNETNEASFTASILWEF